MYYHDKRSLKLSPELEKEVHKALSSIRSLKMSAKRPNRVENKKKCDSCNLREHCYRNSE
jgi:CRISPR/Cas system-associated exonuclease Cas4 (RecB family)